MMVWLIVMLAVILALAATTSNAGAEPVRLHPDNPHYFLFRGEPTVLLTSAEHYGAVLNLDFDYVKYLDALQREGMNHTRLFVGPYCESQASFNITRNTLAPAPGRFACAWARSAVSGGADGGHKFDLTRWDEAFFARLKDFVVQAGRCGVIIEVNLFCPFYADEMWNLSPFHAGNNLNGLGGVDRTQVYTLDRHGGLLAVQEQMVRKIVTELRDFDNLYYEIMNEPYICGVGDDWQHHMAQVIADTEQPFAQRHLISRNIANHKAQVEQADPLVSVLNFHYAWPPDTVGMNYRLGRVIGDNETGFVGTADFAYRREAWAFLLSGGGLYNNLDYSFTVGHEDGTFALPPQQPGGGGPTLRAQLRVLGGFLRGFDFVKMAPLPQMAKVAPGARAFALGQAGRQYAVYLCRDEKLAAPAAVTVALDLPAGTYRLTWLDTLNGKSEARELRHEGGGVQVTSPAFAEDVALGLLAL